MLEIYPYIPKYIFSGASPDVITPFHTELMQLYTSLVQFVAYIKHFGVYHETPAQYHAFLVIYCIVGVLMMIGIGLGYIDYDGE